MTRPPDPRPRRAPGVPLAALAVLAVACAGGGGADLPADAPADLPDLPADVADDPGGPPDAAPDAPPDAAPDAPDLPGDPGAPAWILPPCYRACDRATACGVEACKGYDWPSAGLLFEACFDACDDARADAVLQAADCAAVMAAAFGDLADVAARCDVNPCDPSCAAFAVCVVDQCPALSEAHVEGFRTGCLSSCTSAAAAWIDATPCPDAAAALIQGDPVFAEACLGAVTNCASAQSCAAWGTKLAGCILDQCQGQADPYGPGLGPLLAYFCGNGPDCAPEAEVQAVLDPGVTCDAEGIAGLGLQPPFTALCQGTLGVTPAEVEDACGLLAGCPGAEWLGGVPPCMAFLAVLQDAAPRVRCLQAAADCNGAYDCLEGL